MELANTTKFEDGIVACDNPLDEVFRDEEMNLYSHEAALKKGYRWRRTIGRKE